VAEAKEALDAEEVLASLAGFWADGIEREALTGTENTGD
jgi:hypothetical protein